MVIGQLIDGFRIIDELGSGGMGVVYLAEDVKLNRRVALKLLPPRLMADVERRKRFLREARSAAAIDHPNIAAVYQVGETSEGIYIAMKWVRGRTLRAVSGEDALDVRGIVEVMTCVADAVAKAHAAGVVHRDLKPENIMIDDSGAPVVLDFGIARLGDPVLEPAELGGADTLDVEEETATALTGVGRVVGTIGYMSPEQALGRAVDEKTDVFSLGVVLYELLAGARPFQGDTAMEVITRTARDEPEALGPSVPPPLVRLVVRCLSKVAKDRPSAAAMANDLRDALTLEAEVPPKAATPIAADDPNVARGRRGLIVPAVVALGAVGLVAVAVLVMGPPATDAPRVGASTAPATLAAPSALPITGLPLPTTTSPAALTSYKLGVRALQSANYAGAQRYFDEAVQQDPEMALGHLRVAIAHVFGHGDHVRARAAFRRAAELGLSGRDGALLHALQPFVLDDPSDLDATFKRMLDAVARHPEDAELEMLTSIVAFRRRDYEATLKAATRALALDPQYLDARQLIARALRGLGRDDEAQKALDACIASSPLSHDCLVDRLVLHAGAGRCQEAHADARQVVSNQPKEADGYMFLALAQIALDQDRSVVDKTLETWARFASEPGDMRSRAEALVALDMLDGKFADAVASASELRDRAEGDDNVFWIGSASSLLIDLHVEVGQIDDAGRVAERFLSRRESMLGELFVEPHADPAPLMWATVHRAGKLSRADLDAKIAEWTTSWKQRATPFTTWLEGQARLAETEEDARRALEVMPPATHTERNRLLSAGDVGKVYFLAGDLAHAQPLLEAAAASCLAMWYPRLHTRVHHWLGRVYEERGKTEKACAAYGVVLKRWGDEKPSSLTADAAREHARSLGCAAL